MGVGWPALNWCHAAHSLSDRHKANMSGSVRICVSLRAPSDAPVNGGYETRPPVFDKENEEDTGRVDDCAH